MSKQALAYFSVALFFLVGYATPLFGQVDYEVLTGAAETTQTGYTSGYQLSTWYEDCRAESLYLKSELNAAGIIGNVPISAISFKVGDLPGQSIANLRIRMKHTTATTMTAAFETGYTDCYGPTTLANTVFALNGWYKFVFTTPFIWDGTSNIIVDYSSDGTGYTSGGCAYQRTVTGNRTTYGYSDSFAGAFPFTMTAYQRATVPSIKFTVDGLSIITPATLPSGAENTSYSTNIQASQGTGSYTWTHVSGPLPSGTLAFTQVTGSSGNEFQLAGTPALNSAGTYPLEILVTDGNNDTYQKTMTLYVMPQPASMPFNDDFSTDKGWLYGTDWSRGAAVAYNPTTGAAGRSEPGTDNTPAPNNDNMIAGHVIGGDYAANMSSMVWLTSPPVDCSSATTVSLRFSRWVGITLTDSAKIQVTNNGTTWNDVWTYPGGTSLNDSAWTFTAYDLTTWAAGNSVVQVRFGIGPSSTLVNTGWCIDDVEIMEPGPALEVREGSITGTIITDNEAVGGLRNMGIVNTSTQVSLTISVFNNGLSNINFSGFGVGSKSGANPGDFTLQLGSFNLVLAPQTSTSFNVVFYRTTANISTATINMPHNAVGSGTTPFEINLKAEATNVAPVIQVDLTTSGGTNIPHQATASGTTREFGSVNVGSTSTAVTVVITNTGNGPLSITTLDMGGLWWTDFLITVGTIPATINASQSMSFTVAFKPLSIGVKDAFVRIYHNDSSQSSAYEVPVLGVGQNNAPIINVSDGTNLVHNDAAAGARDFGNILIGSNSTPLTITISNPGLANLTQNLPVLGGAAAAHYTLDTTGYTSPLTPNSSTSFTITFSPTSAGTKNATVSITHDDTSVANPFIINITGIGVIAAPVIEVRETNVAGTQLANPATATGILNFGSRDVSTGPSAASVIFIKNSGTAALIVGIPDFNPTGNTNFVINSTGLQTNLAVGATTSFSITFDPDQEGPLNAVVEFTHNDGTTATPFVLNLTGTGISPVFDARMGSATGSVVTSGDIAALGGNRDCGSINVSAGATTTPVSVFIQNTGSMNLILPTPTLTGANASDFILVGTGGTVTPGGTSLSYSVTFNPTLGGIKNAEIQFTHNDQTSPNPYIVRITGTAIDPSAVQISTSTLPAGSSNAAYPATTLAAIQGTAPYTWSVYSGILPAGLTLSPGGAISGTPATIVTTAYDVVIRVADASGATHEKNFKIIITGSVTLSAGGGGGGCSALNSSLAFPLILLALIAYRRRRRKAY